MSRLFTIIALYTMVVQMVVLLQSSSVLSIYKARPLTHQSTGVGSGIPTPVTPGFSNSLMGSLSMRRSSSRCWTWAPKVDIRKVVRHDKCVSYFLTIYLLSFFRRHIIRESTQKEVTLDSG